MLFSKKISFKEMKETMKSYDKLVKDVRNGDYREPQKYMEYPPGESEDCLQD